MNDVDDIVERVNVCDLDFVFISYDEPKCEEHWSQILRMIPWAKRVHGVNGFDAAHKQAATIAQTQRLITIDGDSIPDPDILDKVLNIRAGIRDHVFSWRARNIIHGLCYGNGSLKCWPREAMLRMSTHEQTTGETGAVDFCWTMPYIHLRRTTSTTYPNGSPYQAFRSGFREGIKMVLNRGVQIPPGKIVETVWDGSIRRLQVWAGIGADVENGYWSMYGTRAGLAMMMEYPASDFAKIADYGWFTSMFEEHVARAGGQVDLSDIHADITFNKYHMYTECESLGYRILSRSGIKLTMLDAQQSTVIKNLIEQPDRGVDYMVEE